MKNRLITSIFILFCLTSNKIYSQLSSKAIAEKSFKSTVLISTIDKNGQPLSLGSGFVIENGVIATNFHVIENSSGGFIKLIGTDRKYNIKGIIEKSEKYDLAILAVETFNAPKLIFGNYDNVSVGDQIYVIGNPNGLEGTFSQGIVSGLRKVDNDELLQITAPISPGSSGGPVLNNNAEVIGLAVASYQSGQNLNFAIPIKYLVTLYNQSDKSTKSFYQTQNTSGSKSLTAAFGENIISGVQGIMFKWTTNQYMGKYTFSIKNNLDKPITNVLCLVIFYDKDQMPFETEYVMVNSYIAPRLAKRTEEYGRIDNDEVRDYTFYTEIRVLNFEFVE